MVAALFKIIWKLAELFVHHFSLHGHGPQQILLVAAWKKALLGVLCPRSLILGSPVGWGYVSSARLPYVALLSLDIINVGLPRVALLLLIIKCTAALPN
jgi:hypothetical protein